MNNKSTPAEKDKIAKNIRKLLLNALTRKGWYFFENPNLVKCWEVMGCENAECPSYNSSNLRCWQVSGSCCDGEPQGDFAKKMGNCHKCMVYKKATQGDICFEIGEDFNNLMFQLKFKEDELLSAVKVSESKNRELEELNREINILLTKLDRKNLQLKELSVKDGLTGLYNYRFFSKFLRDQYKLAKRYRFQLSCIMIDIDFFKAVNDTYGHLAGDEILKQLGTILKKNVRDTDKVVRYGGEEFVILFPHTDSGNAYAKSEQLREMVSGFKFSAGSKNLNITVSIGLATYPAGEKISEAEQLVKSADEALYHAKENGRNQTFLFEGEKAGRNKAVAAGCEKEVLEKRKYPRIQTLVRVAGEMDAKQLYFINTFDISCSGISLVSKTPVPEDRVLNITLYLPGVYKNNRLASVDVEGMVAWCREIDGYFCENTGKRKKSNNYLVGIQFTSLSKTANKNLQKFFASIFEIKKKCLT